MLTRLARFDPDWHRAELLDARQSGNAFAASFHLERLLREYPHDAGLHLQQAEALAQQVKAAEAATQLMHALFLHPRVRLSPVVPGNAISGPSARGSKE
jgi:Flp pilus assembly protein TadD